MPADTIGGFVRYSLRLRDTRPDDSSVTFFLDTVAFVAVAANLPQLTEVPYVGNAHVRVALLW